MPIFASVKRTDSTATNPPLDIDRDVAPLCVMAAAAFVSVRSPVAFRLPFTVTIPAVAPRSIIVASPLIPIWDPVNRTDSTSTVPSDRIRTCSTAAVEPLVEPRVPKTKSPFVSPAALVCSYAITAGGLCCAAFPTYPNPMS